MTGQIGTDGAYCVTAKHSSSTARAWAVSSVGGLQLGTCSGTAYAAPVAP